MHFFLVAGEASGDQLGAGLITELKKRHPSAEFSGIAGPCMIAAGCQPWARSEALSVMGLAEVVRHLPRLLKLRRQLLDHLRHLSPDCFIGIDAPDFNLPVERHAKSMGMTCIHYVSPSVWAWRRKRVAKMYGHTDLVLTLFPFEPPIYQPFEVPATFVGHPFADQIPIHNDRQQARAALHLDDSPVLAVLPGSRMSEISRLAPPFAAACARLAEQFEPLQVVVPCVHERAHTAIEQQFLKHAPNVTPRYLPGQARQALAAANVTLIASGTATLEALLCKCPMVVAYKLAPLTHFIVRTLGMLKTETYSLPNILSGRPLVPELMQTEANAKQLALKTAELLSDAEQRQRQRDAFEKIHRTLRCGASRSAADAVSALVEKR